MTKIKRIIKQKEELKSNSNNLYGKGPLGILDPVNLNSKSELDFSKKGIEDYIAEAKKSFKIDETITDNKQHLNSDTNLKNISKEIVDDILDPNLDLKSNVGDKEDPYKYLTFVPPEEKLLPSVNNIDMQFLADTLEGIYSKPETIPAKDPANNFKVKAMLHNFVAQAKEALKEGKTISADDINVKKTSNEIIDTEVKFINDSKLEFTDISSELYRIYEFNNGKTIMIDGPLKLNISKSGGHRLYDSSGMSHYIPQGWIRVSWKTKPNQPNFVK